MENEYFSFNTSLRVGSLSAAFLRSGRALVGITGNVDTRQEIGDYETTLPGNTVDRLRKLKASIDLDRLQSPDSLRPGEATITIGESRGPEGPVPYVWALSGIPPAVQPLLDEARRLSEEVMKHPVRVLRGRGAARGPLRANAPAKSEVTLTNLGTQPLRVSKPRPANAPATSTLALEREMQPLLPQGPRPPSAPATFEVTLECVGTQPLRATNPLSTMDPKHTGVRLVVTRDGAAAGEPGSEHWLELTPQDLLPSPGAAPDRAPILELKPGEKRTFFISRAVPAAPGRYHAFLLYDSIPPRGDDDFLEGTIRIDLGGFDLAAATP